MSQIRVLSSDVINKIAAGEVVERPASVVKELVENALDAGASKVEITLVDGGRELIQVVDDGRGMSREDAELALERHATSKLREAEGLFHILSFGFRGEAVPAIASVSRLTLTTRRGDDLEGTRIEIEGGALRGIEPCGAPRGTTFSVRDLFFATPARRKFLKRPETEVGHVTDSVIRLALSRPDVGFTFRSNGRVVFQSPANADPRERIAAAIGKDIHPHLLPVHQNQGRYSVRGHIASPAWSAPSNRSIYTFVNGRYVRDRQLLHAVGRAYTEALPQGRHPGVVLFLEMPPGELDVNVHPQKMEVRFSEPRGVYDAIYRTITHVLKTGDWLSSLQESHADTVVPTRSHTVPASPQPVFDWHTKARRAALAGEREFPGDAVGVAEAAAGLWPRSGDREAAGAFSASGYPEGFGAFGGRPGDPEGVGAFGGRPGDPEGVGAFGWRPGDPEGAGSFGWRPGDPEGAGAFGFRPGDPEGALGHLGILAPQRGPGSLGPLRFAGQLAGTYLLCEAPAGDLVVIDRRVAVERIAFHRLREAYTEGQPDSQPFLFPTTLELGLSDARGLVGHLDRLLALGLEVEPFGGTTFALKSVPSPVVGADYRKLLSDLAADLARGDEGPDGLLRVLARHAGQRRFEALTDDEATELLLELGAAGGVGAAGAVEIPLSEIEKRFDRR